MVKQKGSIIQTVIMFICLTIMFAIFSGCSEKAAEKTSQEMSTAQQVSTKIETRHDITDMAGRKINIPSDIKRIYSTGQPGVVMLYTLCPDKLLGWCTKLSEEEKEYIAPKYQSLPVLGNMQGANNSANKEEIMRQKPDIIILMTSIDKSTSETADKIQASMDIPVVVVDYSLKNLDKSYAFLGSILVEEKRADVLAEYCKKTIDEAVSIAAKIPNEETVSVYYAQGAKGLQTAPAGSSHSEVIEMVGGRNVVKLQAGKDERLAVNMEQVLAWNPDVIITSNSMDSKEAGKNGSGTLSTIAKGSGTWSVVKAVKNQCVFNTPSCPYNWLDMPPSVNRIIGIKWMGNLLYPKYFDYDIKGEIEKFYSQFYNVELSETQLSKLLNNATRK